MPLSIINVRLATSQEWDEFWEGCDYSTYFHSREWVAIWQKYVDRKLRPAGQLITFSDKRTVLLPFSSRNHLLGFIKQYYSSPGGTYGGWLSFHTLTEEHGIILNNYIHTHYKNLFWRLNPYDPIVKNIRANISKIDTTQALNLTQGFESLDKLWRRSDFSIIRKVKKALNSNVRIREAASIQDWEKYYLIYEDSLNRWGEFVTSVYKWSLFQGMYEDSFTSNKALVSCL